MSLFDDENFYTRNTLRRCCYFWETIEEPSVIDEREKQLKQKFSNNVYKYNNTYVHTYTHSPHPILMVLQAVVS